MILGMLRRNNPHHINNDTEIALMRIIGYAATAALLGLAVLLPSQGKDASAATQCGLSSWYAMTSITASGERASPATMTAAHRSLPFGTKVRVRNLSNGRSVVVRINDRGPVSRRLIIDVTRGVAARLGFVNKGITKVCLEPA
jgi:rare lipoprotein A